MSARVDQITSTILILRGQRVILDADLAALYGVGTKRLNEQVKRNASRFPQDFVFRLNRTEVDALNRSQIATGSQKHRDPRLPPLAFTEHGAIMAATILNSQRAVEMSLYVVRAFVQLRDSSPLSLENAAGEARASWECNSTRHRRKAPLPPQQWQRVRTERAARLRSTLGRPRNPAFRHETTVELT